MAVNLSESDDYEAMASAFQAIEIKALDDSLRLCGIADDALRRKACERYFEYMASFCKRAWFAFHDKRLAPRVCFQTILTREEAEAGTDSELFLSQEDWDAAESLHGNMEWYYEVDPEECLPETGVYYDGIVCEGD